MPHTELPAIEVELTKRLGQLAISWASIENWLAHLLASLVNADLGAMQAITGEMGAATMIKAIKVLISVHEPKDPSLSAVRELVEYADDIRMERNELIHGAWDPTNCEPGTCLVQTVAMRWSEIIRERLVTTHDIDLVLADCDNWTEDFVTLGRQFNFPRRRGESKSIFSD